MKSRLLTYIVLFASFIAAIPLQMMGQNISRIKEDPSYIWAEALSQSEEQASETSYKGLVNKLSGIIAIHSNPNINRQLVGGFKKELESASHEVLTREKRGHCSFRYIHNDSIKKIFDSRRSKIVEMLSMAESALERLQIDIALRNLSWAEILLQSIPQPEAEAYRSRNGKINSAPAWVKATISEILGNLNASYKTTNANNKAIIAIDFTYKGKPVRSIDYRFYDGTQWSGLYSAKDGRGIVENNSSSDLNKFRIRYESSHSHLLHIDSEIKHIQELISSQGTDEEIAKQRKELETDTLESISPDEIKNKILSVLAQHEENPQHDTTRLEIAAVHNTADLEQVIDRFCSAIEDGTYSLPDSLFAHDGLSIFNRLMRYGNARIIERRELHFYRLGEEIYCRSIPMVFSFNGNNRSFVEDIVLTFNKENRITNITFALHKDAAGDIVSHSNWPEEARIIIVSFLENYKTAYALERLDYISSLFDDQALIITGRVLKNAKIHNELMDSRFVSLTKQNKAQYISRLKQVFAANEFINVSFNTSEVLMLGKGSRMYGIQLSQDYYSSNYSDKGYLFLMVDLKDHTQPVIHVRTWQTKPDKEFGIIGPYHF